MIEVKSVTKTFADVTALTEMSCSIKKGSVYGLVGTNGAGKSTLLRLLSGVYTPDRGEITIDGEEVFENPSVKSRLFFLADVPYYIHQSTVMEMAKFYARFYESFRFERLQYLSTVFPIGLNAKFSSMSKGMQRQAMLMLALSCDPDYLLLDEAFDGLDPVIRTVVKKLLAESISEKNMTVIIASHNLRELEDLCDSVGLLHKGGILFDSDLDTLKSSIVKVQIAFADQSETVDFGGIELLKLTKQGSLYHLVVRGNRDEIIAGLQAMKPLFLEAISPTLEEVFIYELEVTGYDVEKILC